VYPHRIRLRGPWECEPANLPARRVVMPARWGEIGLGEFAGSVRFRRRFGYPSRIDPHETVWLTFAGIAGRASIHLNGHALASAVASSEPLECPITPLLRPRNELIVDIEATGPQSGLWGEVALEVRCTAYLRSVGVEWTDDCLTVQGEVVGVAEGPLELYALVDGRTVVYSPVSALPEGQPFRFVSEPLAGLTPHEFRVDLVSGAVVWYTWAQTQDFR
jgi:hypothetical protein